jgi:hypothetical protein
MRDYRRLHAALLRKADDPAVGPSEAHALRARAAMLRENHPEAFEMAASGNPAPGRPNPAGAAPPGGGGNPGGRTFWLDGETGRWFVATNSATTTATGNSGSGSWTINFTFR